MAAAAVAAAVLPGCAPTASAEPVRVVAVTAATLAQPQPTLGGAGLLVVRRAAESDRGTFTLFIAGEPALTLDLDLVARRGRESGTEVEYGPRRAELLDARVRDAAAAVAEIAAAEGEPDLLDVIALAAQGAPGTLLVLDSGISTVDPLDLRELDWAADPAIVVEYLKTRDHLPDLRGWEVLFVGLGRTAGPQQELDLPQRRWLERLWMAICEAGGARTCMVDATGATASEPLSTRTVPPVGIPASETVPLPNGSVRITLPDARLGFAPGSAELTGDAASALEPVLAAHRALGPAHRMRVTGYVAFWGDEAYRMNLSRARADAVVRWLVEHGADTDVVIAEGAGAADGPDASLTDGRFDEKKVARNGIRRVVVTIEKAA